MPFFGREPGLFDSTALWTPWLSETWCKRCVCFSRPVNVGQPYLKIPFPNVSSRRPNLGNLGPNPYLVGLGIILLELSENKSFDEWLSGRDDCIFPEDNIAKSMLGKAWLEEIVAGSRMSEQYTYVVQLCLTSTFCPVPSSTMLGNEGFREAVFCHILRPLEREYHNLTKELEFLTERSEDEY